MTPSAVVAFLRGEGVLVTETPELRFLHDDLSFEPPCTVSATISLAQSFRIGAFTHLNGGYVKDVTIGRYCSFARDVQIGHGGHPTNWLSVSPLQYGANYRGWPAFAAKVTGGPDRVATRDFAWAAHTVIGNDVWLGNHVVVVDGVTIGDGAVVGAGSVVTRDVPPYAVVAGAPARILRYRFPEPVIERLLAVAWWRYSMTDFGDVDFSDVGRCLDRIEDLIAADAIRPYAPGTVGSDAIRRGCKPA